MIRFERLCREGAVPTIVVTHSVVCGTGPLSRVFSEDSQLASRCWLPGLRQGLADAAEHAAVGDAGVLEGVGDDEEIVLGVEAQAGVLGV